MLKLDEAEALNSIALKEEHLSDARLFADRFQMIRFFSECLRNGNIAEVGVLFGDFSRFLIDEINPPPI